VTILGGTRARVTDPDVLVFRRRKQRTSAWEDRVLKSVEPYYASDVNSIQEELILAASFYDMNELMEIQPMPGSIFVLSQSEPFDEEGEMQHDKLLNWCDYYGMPQYHAHASGHAAPHELKTLIRTIKPKTVFPVHTERPGLLKHYISDLECLDKPPEKDKTIQI
jgi:ribonuclease J